MSLIPGLPSLPDPLKVGKKVLDEAGKAVDAAGKALGSAKDAVESIPEKVVGLVPDRILLDPPMLPYTPLSPVERVAAEQRSVGMTYPQRSIQGDSGKRHEPITLAVSGSREKLIETLQKAGWTQADDVDVVSGAKTALTTISRYVPGVKYDYEAVPMANMYLDGRPNEFAFNKNSDHGVTRDHMRIFKTDKTDEHGDPIWEIAATRDTALGISPKDLNTWHEIDKNLDPERDMVMADLLGTGRVKSWHVAKGELDPADAESCKKYQTDGKVYVVSL